MSMSMANEKHLTVVGGKSFWQVAPSPEIYVTKTGERAVRYSPPGGVVAKTSIEVAGETKKISSVLWSGYRNGFFTAIVSVES